jgi:nucleoside-diphosphate-sugar epimerase
MKPVSDRPGIDARAGTGDRRVFVTGVTSQLGREVSCLLAENGSQVTGLVRDAAHARGLPPDMSLIEGTCEEVSRYRDALHGSSRVIHVAGMRLVPSLMRACAGHPSLERIVFISSARVHFPDRLLSRSEREGKRILAEQETNVSSTSLPWTILRPTLIHSPTDRSVSKIVARIQSGRVFPVPGSGNVIRQPISARDLAASVGKALFADSARRKVYDVPGRDITFVDMINTIQQLLGRNVALVHVPRYAVSALRAIAGLWSENSLTAACTRYLRWYEDLSCDGTDAARDFGHAPRDFAVNMREQFESVRNARTGVGSVT